MKKIFLISMLGLILACCTKEHEVNGGGVGDDPNAQAVTDYLTVSLVAAGNASSRAGDGSTADDDTYKDGDAYENNVKMIRFYFFDGEDKAAPAWKLNGSNAYESFIDWYPSAGSVQDPEQADKEETVEKIVADITLGLNTVEGKRPTQILAVVNPSAALLTLKKSYKASEEESALTIWGLSLEDILGALTDDNYLTGLKHQHQSNPGAATEGNFVMSNSVYLDESNNLVKTVKLEKKNYRDQTDDDKETKVVIYVERVVSRLDLKNTLENESKSVNVDGVDKTIYKLGTFKVEGETEDLDQTTGEKAIYVSLEGWNVTATPVKSRLVKEIDKAWGATFFGNLMLWNVPDFHRSFWALNPTLDDETDYQYGRFDKNAKDASGEPYPEDQNTNPANGKDFPAKDGTVSVYMQENAGKSTASPAASNPTKVILAARLVDENGKNYDLAEWAYKKYTLESLTNLFANSILGLYSKTETGSKTEFTKILPGQLTFKTQSSFATEDQDYYVYATLTDDAKYTDPEHETEREWYTKNDLANEDDTMASNFTKVTNVDQYIYDRINHVKVWKGGLTYYFFDIEHLGATDKPGEFGVVRNHIYQASVKSLKGLGTPVYDPDNEVIIPEKPQDDESIITTEVKILQWRIVSHEYEIQWPD